jgi:hypothetical protein
MYVCECVCVSVCEFVRVSLSVQRKGRELMVVCGS